jgi:hypothetical protein
MQDEYLPTSENEASFDDIEVEDEITVTHGRSEETEENNNIQEEAEEEHQEPEEEYEDDINASQEDYGEQEQPQEEEVEQNTEENETYQEEDEYVSDEEYYSSLTEAVGYEINSDEDIIAIAQRLNELEENPYQNLPKEAQMVADIINNGGDYRNSLRLLSMDTESLDDREILRESYLLDSKVSSNRELAELQFEKKFDDKYGILDELNKISDPDERAEFEEENSREIKLAQLSFEQEVKDAKERIGSYVDENTTKSPSESLSQEEREEIIQHHTNMVQQTVGEDNGITFNFGENGEHEFNIQLREDQQEGLQDFLTNPAEFFREELGFDVEKGMYTSYEQMSALYTLITNLDSIPDMLGQFYMEKSDKRSVEEIVQNTERPRTTNSRPQREGQGIDLDIGPDFPD